MKPLFLFFIPLLSFSQINFDKINKKTEILASKYLKKEDIPGMSISISYNDTIIFSQGFGFADLEKKTKIFPSKTKFEIASITKMITSAVLGKMYEQGTIDWNKTPHFYLDSLAKKPFDFTIKQLAGHIAGLRRNASEEKWSLDNKYSKKDFYRVFTKDSLQYQPQTNFVYSNYGFSVLGFVIEKIYHKNVFDIQNDLIFKPLQMNNTFIDDGHYDENTVTFYKEIENKKVKITEYVYNNTSYSAGCHLSTSEDLIKLGNAFLFANRLLKQETLVELIKPQKLNFGGKTFYGMGVNVNKDIYGNFNYGHGGNAISARSKLLIYPSSKLIIVMLANKSKTKEDNFVEKIADNYIQFLNNKIDF
ncbi:MAG: hypothetical protein CMP76_08865 [Flavobacterium sp.]|uniref:serine hydrolase domain-containing protein n=1 Tax=Flavobacterium sp. TaxID=239 RepID=UPI000C44F25F|nr:serine hydrolase domain-containing protein [Flavobacterium sp.]MBF03392.1 hypothetical protein [Flavobacterium sp.]|tara:strand:+ start:151 stop:1236 length:1086 start_codon:yes stop_codon:yes gene_type:complete